MRLILLLFPLTFVFFPPESPLSRAQIIPYFEKKAKKIIKKEWKGQTIRKEEQMTKDTTPLFPDRHLFKLYNKEEQFIAYFIISKSYGCRIGGCNGGDLHPANGPYEAFYYSAIFNPDLTIRRVDILDYPSEYGYEIGAKNWLRQFKGQKPCGGLKGIDIISGATVSCNSLSADLVDVCWLLNGE